MSFVIAVDGPAASGKGTVAQRLAVLYGLPYLDTGLLYRAVGVTLIEDGLSLDDPQAAEAAAEVLCLGALAAMDLRGRMAGEAASRVAVHPGVRAALLELQRGFARQDGGAVLDGRDIGTVIAPGAEVKIYVTASAEVRAERRWKQLASLGETVSYEDVLADIRKRDARDGGRDAAPMTMAEGAVLLDTTEMDIEAATDAARRIVEAARARGFSKTSG
jgi:cytidylate kinase